MPLLSGDLTIGPGQNILLNDTIGYEVAFNTPINFTNRGSVTVTFDDPIFYYQVIGYYQPFVGPVGQFWNRAGATFRVQATGFGDAFGIRGSDTPTIINDGLLEVMSAGGGAFGVYGLSSSFTNNGSLIVGGAGHALGAGFNGPIVNTGVIDVTGGVLAIGVNVQDQFSTVTNSGLIKATSTGPFASMGVAMFGNPGETLTISNLAGGVVQGDFAFKEIQILVSMQFLRHVIENGGTADGAIDLGLGDDEVDNTGDVSGYVALGQGADLYHGGGILSGPLFGGFGDDTIVGGAGAETLHGEENDDSIDGAAGADWLDGGHDDDSLFGGADADSLYGGHGDDLMQGGGGNDELDGWYGADTLQGGAGADTIVISHAPYSSGAAFDTAIAFDFAEDEIRIPTAPAIIDAPITAGALSQATFAADMAAAVTALSAGGALLFSPTTGDYAGSSFLVIDANNSAGYQDGADIVIRLQSAANVGMFGLATFVSGPSFYDRLPLNFTSSPLFGHGREIYGDFTIYEDETLNLDLQGEPIGLAAMNLTPSHPPMTITNLGNFLVSSGTGATAFAATAPNPIFQLTFINAAMGYLRVEGSGAGVGSAYHFRNDGVIEVFSSDGGGGAGGSATFVNTGLINVTAAGSAKGVGVESGALFDNSGQIVVQAGAAAGFAYGVQVSRLATFNNSGTIRITESSPTTEGVAVAYSNPGGWGQTQTFQNSGLIEGEWAFKELSDYTTQVTRDVILNTGVIIGKISLGDGADEIQNSNQIVGAIDLGAGDDKYSGSGTVVGVVSGGAGNDQLFAGAAGVTFSGGAGDDILRSGSSPDHLDGGAGADALDYSTAAAKLTIRLWNQTATGVAAAVGDTLTSIENAFGGSAGDAIVGADAVANLLAGNGGDDVLYGLSGDDILRGGQGADYLNGGTGSDIVDFSDATAALVVRLWNQSASGGVAAGDTISGFEGAIGGVAADAIVGSDNVANILSGGGGNDALYGLSGYDVLRGGAGADNLNGGSGVDTVDYSDAIGGVVVRLWNQTATGDIATGDVIAGFERVFGGAGWDKITGSDIAANYLVGNGGNDVLHGLSGDDILVGGAGNDTLTGGAGNDRFDFSPGSGGDWVIDFTPGGAGDVIRLVGFGSPYDTFAEVLNAATQSGPNVSIALGATVALILFGVQKSALVADDFTFG